MPPFPCPEAPILRPARPTDREALVVLLAELFSLEADFTPDPERQRRGLALLLDGSPDRQVFVVEVRGRVAGMATVQVLISTAEGGPAGLVEDVVVAREHRGQGLGTRLLAEVEAWARARGLTRLQLLADRENLPALHFYEGAGWSPTQLACWRRKLPSSPGRT
jgi:GNAT superfamily N-acetyltransferase